MATPSFTPIEKTLLTATKLKSKSGQDRQKYLVRVCKAVQELDEELWDKLPEDAQRWVNDASKAFDAKKDLPEFPDLNGTDNNKDEKVADSDDHDDATDGADESNDNEEEDVKSTKKTKSKSAPKAKTKDTGSKSKATDTETPKSTKVSGIKADIKKMMIKKPSMTVEEIMERLTKSGSTPSRFTVAGIRAEFRHSLKVLIQEKMLDIEL